MTAQTTLLDFEETEKALLIVTIWDEIRNSKPEDPIEKVYRELEDYFAEHEDEALRIAEKTLERDFLIFKKLRRR